jgi:hypothetical protein
LETTARKASMPSRLGVQNHVRLPTNQARAFADARSPGTAGERGQRADLVDPLAPAAVLLLTAVAITIAIRAARALPPRALALALGLFALLHILARQTRIA